MRWEIYNPTKRVSFSNLRITFSHFFSYFSLFLTCVKNTLFSVYLRRSCLWHAYDYSIILKIIFLRKILVVFGIFRNFVTVTITMRAGIYVFTSFLATYLKITVYLTHLRRCIWGRSVKILYDLLCRNIFLQLRLTYVKITY